eukprot:GDKI01015797.1.p1 GENE.GDKI01015797.1~~GDKI01015797.1.p1  ORF type:complete len:247 (+),score=82.47 GDKI01015797.1:91-831(+)
MPTETSIELAKQAIQSAKVVCFDVDSTVLTSEAIDDLASYLGKAEEVSRLTKLAMEGGMPYQEALHLRLEAMQPSLQQLRAFCEGETLKLSPGIAELVALLHARGTHVWLVSGGFRAVIEPVAEALEIPKARIYANRLLFDEESGAYKGFDREEPTSRDGGKAEVVGRLKQQHGSESVIVMVGDGATDLQARPPADAFIGYGGVVVREKVAQGADWFVRDFQEVIQLLKGGSGGVCGVQPQLVGGC